MLGQGGFSAPTPISEMQKVQPYKTLKRGEPPVRDKPADTDKLKSTESQRKRCVIHALSRANNEGVRPEPANQKIPSLNGFQATLNPKNCKKQTILSQVLRPASKQNCCS